MRAQPAADLEAVDARHDHIEQNQIRVSLLEQLQRLLAAAGGIDMKSRR
ncbi:MAG: hypothetical protein VBE63_05830 [Lamprobacter sp.]|nr:hypothetical protein [Lamprobacter sp.]MEA3639448.1 hypothetical protein [Lamprobacter sp.]